MIELKNIIYEVKEQDKTKRIIDNVSCVFEDNCIVGITGQNGSGKSTLTKIIMGIIKPTSGLILFNGKDVTNSTITERANMGINYAFQQPILFNGITIKELIDMATNENNSVPKACKYLSMVGLCAKEYINRNFDKTLSGGEQKRIELALAIAKKGSCLIFDEPEAGIDLWSFEKLNEIFDKQRTFIIVSHQEKLLKNADKILVMSDGKIVAYDKSINVLNKLPKVCGKIGGGNND